MKMFRIILCFFIIFSFASCSKEELSDLSGFIDKYNFYSKSDLLMTDFIIQNNPDISYTAILSSDILLSLSENTNRKIESCKIALIKDNNKTPNSKSVIFFNETVINVLYAYCSYDKTKVENIIDSFNLRKTDIFLKDGELSLKADNFYFVYYSTSVISEFIIYNTYIKDIEPTEKPVSRPYFGEDIIIKDKETP